MPRIKKPRALAELTGAARHDPKRWRPEPATKPLGDPPERLSPAERAVWFELVANDRAGCIRQSDAILLEIASGLIARFRQEGRAFPVTLLRVLRECLARLGQ